MNHLDLAAHFGASVRRLRFRLGISQEELAGRANLHRTYIAGIERGGRNITLKSIEKLARALEVSTADLLTPGHKSETREGRLAAPGLSSEILLVEDDPTDVEMTLDAFKEAGIANPVQVVSDGAAALDYLFCAGSYAHRPPSAKPAVVLLDLNLPKINGVEVLRRIKRHPSTREIPVIVLSASEKTKDITECHRLGVSTYIIKPFSIRSFSGVTPQLNLQWALLSPGTTLAAA